MSLSPSEATQISWRLLLLLLTCTHLPLLLLLLACSAFRRRPVSCYVAVTVSNNTE
jgi:hypothetical protein